MIGYTITGMLPAFGGNGYLLIDAANPAIQYRFDSRRIDNNGQQVEFPELADGYSVDLELINELQRPITPDNWEDEFETLEALGDSHSGWLNAGQPASEDGWERLNNQLDTIERDAREQIDQLRRWRDARQLWQVSVLHSRDLACTPVGPEHTSILDAVHWLAMVLGRNVLDACTGKLSPLSQAARNAR